MRRCILIIIDGLGIGAQEDASEYGDKDADTLGHVCSSTGVLLPNLRSLGLGNIKNIDSLEPVKSPLASYGKMREVSAGKDSTTGHWELAGIHLEKAFPVYKDGFPDSLIERFCTETGVDAALCGKPYSGTDVIKEYGEEHIRTGYPIIYTSADSVFQIATHDDVISVDELYRICSITREKVCVGDDLVGRVIARPFTGQPGSFTRITDKRHDFSAIPPEKNLNEYLQKHDVRTISVGKVIDLFAEKGFDESHRTKNNAEGIEEVIRILSEEPENKRFIFTNLIDTDQLYGHRLDPEGYAGSLKEFDTALPEILKHLQKDDLLIITGDHGNDPCVQSTDHTREFVPVLVYSKASEFKSHDLGIRSTFSDVANTVSQHFGHGAVFPGQAMLR